MANGEMFSQEYGLSQEMTTSEREAAESRRLEVDLEKEIAEGARRYGTGKPRREVYRARLVNDQST